MNIQTRSETNGLRFFKTADEAIEAAEQDPTIWKISYSFDEKRIRLVKDDSGRWVREDLLAAAVMADTFQKDD